MFSKNTFTLVNQRKERMKNVIFDLFIELLFFTQTILDKITYGSAIKGYDPVAYFLEQKAIKGKSEFAYKWSGNKWLFCSQANLDAFKANPHKYAPQYGGLCAYGVSLKRKVHANPLAWTIVDNKLYLNYSLKVRELWLKDFRALIQRANEFWPLLNL